MEREVWGNCDMMEGFCFITSVTGLMLRGMMMMMMMVYL
jgi:hypothetical protein